ncbi:protein indeterminate-domain 5, chloroplastic-like [Glycine soja]|uniref:protein indeterminate-domain 5, chloroplastic-like n=1 Tax=Glycine soja TaxID=3848 RepID=UPI00103CE8F9|nr:protein indeterminate-domain 5, chloroplastic-like [Glycine soja]XP_028220098.1 protein indeterminate-domain 5, chloroplastic-like [Glycine soja]XP_028220099.1 protein indeterminate-domain 5, chloroplastic-like [Glycine soja]
MAASSSSASLFGFREEDQNQMKQQHSLTPSSSTTPAAPPPQKKKRNQPGTPYPDAEVIALSPKTLMATNRFICEVCNKGFQREQNLQLHRRGHNLPWKLKQKTTKEPKRKVYLCPEPTCVHHDPSRALGDLTGIKKHYSRKHGEKKWKCDKCSKKYAVQSDWKAHSKTCGTREYRCDCGTLFSRRDSFITHRAFCDALAQESARQPPSLSGGGIGSHLYGSTTNMALNLSQVGSQISTMQDPNAQPTELLRLGAASGRTGQFDHILGSPFRPSNQQQQQQPFFMSSEPNQTYHHPDQNKPFQQGLMQLSDHLNNNSHHNNSPFSLPFLSNNTSNASFSEHFNNANGGGGNNNNNNNNNNEGTNYFATSSAPSLFSNSVNASALSHMSATALLQKAAQMGATTSNGGTASLLKSFGSASSSSGGGSKLVNAANYVSGMFGGNNHVNEQSNSNLQNLVNSFAVGGNSSIFEDGFEAYEHSNNNSNRDPKVHAMSGSSSSIGGSDRLTRDFLGVGQIVRGMSGSGGVAQREQQQQHGFNLSSLEAERYNNNSNNAAPSSGQAFGGGGGNFQ